MLSVEQRIRDGYVRGEGLLLKSDEAAYLWSAYAAIRETAAADDERGLEEESRSLTP